MTCFGDSPAYFSVAGATEGAADPTSMGDIHPPYGPVDANGTIVYLWPTGATLSFCGAWW